MRRDWFIVGGMWVALTVIGEVVVKAYPLLPEGYSAEAKVVDDAFQLLMYLAVPVFAFTVTMIVVSIIRFRHKGRPTEDGPALNASPRLIMTWLAITGALDLAVLINPGFVGLSEIRGSRSADLVVNVAASRWVWAVTYENGAKSDKELVVPVGSRVRFDVTSTDIIHSFWIPAFGEKIDAVPGRTTQIYFTTKRQGSHDGEPQLRVQCAELCGLGHAAMSIPVRVVPKAEYDSYVEQLRTAPPDTGATTAAAGATGGQALAADTGGTSALVSQTATGGEGA